SVYVPNGARDLPAKIRFLEGLEKFAATAQTEGVKLLLCGDLNVAREERDVHPKLRKQDQIGTTPLERELLAKILARGLHDHARAERAAHAQPLTTFTGKSLGCSSCSGGRATTAARRSPRRRKRARAAACARPSAATSKCSSTTRPTTSSAPRSRRCSRASDAGTSRARTSTRR